MGMAVSYELESIYFALSGQPTESLWRWSERAGPVYNWKDDHMI